MEPVTPLGLAHVVDAFSQGPGTITEAPELVELGVTLTLPGNREVARRGRLPQSVEGGRSGLMRPLLHAAIVDLGHCGAERVLGAGDAVTVAVGDDLPHLGAPGLPAGLLDRHRGQVAGPRLLTVLDLVDELVQAGGDKVRVPHGPGAYVFVDDWRWCCQMALLS